MTRIAEVGPEQRAVTVTLLHSPESRLALPLPDTEQAIDDRVAQIEGIGTNEPAYAEHYEIEEWAYSDQMPGASLTDRPMFMATWSGNPDIYAPIGREVFERIHPPLPPDAANFLAVTLGRMGVQYCIDVLQIGLVGLARGGFLGSEIRTIAGLTERLSGQKVPLHPVDSGQ